MAGDSCYFGTVIALFSGVCCEANNDSGGKLGLSTVTFSDDPVFREFP
jgi:hypothetical protein